MKRTGLATAAIAMLLLLCSCASSDRMMRLSPMNTGYAVPRINLDKNLVNLWPFYYNDNQFMTVLWPMFDFDDKGFAIRPFYNKEGYYHSILFPLSSWNTIPGTPEPHTGPYTKPSLDNKRSGYALNVLWSPGAISIIPFFFLDMHGVAVPPLFMLRHSNFTWIMPVYWTKEKAFGAFPLFYYKPDSYFSALFPFSYFDKDKGWVLNTYWDKKTLAFFPVFTSQPDFKQFLNIYWRYTEEGELDNYGFFPLFHHDPGFRHWLAPLYYYHTNNNVDTLITPLFGYTKSPDKLKMLSILTAAYYSSDDDDEQVRAICWPLFFHELKNNRERYHLLPFYSYDTGWPALVNWTDDEPINNGLRDNFNILGPLGYQNTYRVYQPSYQIPKSARIPSGKAVRNISKQDEDDSILLGLSGWGTERYLSWKPEYETQLSKLAALWGYRTADANVNLHTMPQEQKDKLIAEILAQFPEIPVGAKQEEAIRILLEKYTVGSESNYHQLLPFYRYRSYQDNYHWSVLFYLLANGYRDEEARGLRINPFFSYKTGPGMFHLSIFWPLFQYRRLQGEDYQWHTLFFLARGEKNGNDRDFQILRYLYRHTVEGDAEQYSVFPFISYRKDKEKKQFSFLWRIFNYEKSDKQTSGHIFFIPW